VNRLIIMSTDRIEKLYKNFGILADSKDKSEVSLHLILVLDLIPYGNTLLVGKSSCWRNVFVCSVRGSVVFLYRLLNVILRRQIVRKCVIQRCSVAKFIFIYRKESITLTSGGVKYVWPIELSYINVF
jgi:hypothetical protein